MGYDLTQYDGVAAFIRILHHKCVVGLSTLRYLSLDNYSNIFSTGADVRFSLKGTIYQNNSLVNLEDIGEGDDALFCVTDQTACCRPPHTGFTIGNWYFPNETRVPSSGAQWDFHRTRGQSTVLLHRRRGGANGVYRCDISDTMNVTQIIYIGVYTANTGK